MKTLVIHPKDKTTDFLKTIYHGRGWTVINGGCTKADVDKAIEEHDHIIMLGHGTPQGLLAMGNFNGKPKPAVKPTVKPSTAIRTIAGSKPVAQSHIKDFYSAYEEKEDDWFDDRKVGSYKPYGTGNTYGGYTGNYQSLSTGYVIDNSTADKLRGKKLTAIWCNADQYMEWNDLEGFYTGMFISDTSEAMMIGTEDTELWQVEESNYGFCALVRLLVEYPSDEMLKHLKMNYAKMAKRNAVAKYNLLRLYTRQVAKAKQAPVAV